jgi:hypothetical protein
MKGDSLNSGINWFELDRLVDGQLAPHEYRELLRQIDRDPDGWRQCALAFLQHQALEKEMKAMGGLSLDKESPLKPDNNSVVLSGQTGRGKVLAERRPWSRGLGGLATGIVCACAAAMAGITAGSHLTSRQPESLGISGVLPSANAVIRDQERQPPVLTPLVHSWESQPRASSHFDPQQVLEDDEHLRCRHHSRCRNQ